MEKQRRVINDHISQCGSWKKGRPGLFRSGLFYADVHGTNVPISSLLDPSELLETLTAREEYQRADEQPHIDDDGDADNRPANCAASMKVVANVEQRRSGKRQVWNSKRQQRDRQPGVEDIGRAPVISSARIRRV